MYIYIYFKVKVYFNDVKFNLNMLYIRIMLYYVIWVSNTNLRGCVFCINNIVFLKCILQNKNDKKCEQRLLLEMCGYGVVQTVYKCVVLI